MACETPVPLGSAPGAPHPAAANPRLRLRELDLRLRLLRARVAHRRDTGREACWQAGAKDSAPKPYAAICFLS